MAYKPSAKLVERWENEVMAKTHGLKPGALVTLNYAAMTPGTAQYWRGLVGVITLRGGAGCRVTLTSGLSKWVTDADLECIDTAPEAV